MADVKHLVDRFLAWPLPASVRSDLCVTMDYPHQRSGTNLLTAAEAQAMLEYVLGGKPPADATPEPRVSEDDLVNWSKRAADQDIAAPIRTLALIRAVRDARGDIEDLQVDIAGLQVALEERDATIASQAEALAAEKAEFAKLSVAWDQLHARATTAEAALKAAREALTEIAECNGLHMGDVLDIAVAALSPPTKES